MDHQQNTYAFILGLNHSLSKVEIINVLTQKKIDFELGACSQEVLMITTNADLDALSIEDFGGVVKFVKVVSQVPLEEFFLDRNDFATSINPPEYIDNGTEKVTFGLNVYGAGCKYKDLSTSWYYAPKVCAWIRKEFAKQNIKSSFLPLLDRHLSTVAVDKNKLLTEGFELSLLAGEKDMYIGKTLAVQDYGSYSFRDYGRPNRDSGSGMIPPKLAKIMINLANRGKTDMILDPFCGSGTVLEEMILLGYINITGSDISEEAVTDTRANLDWLFEHYTRIDRNNFDIRLMTADVTELSKHLAGKSIDAVVTEPFLGSPHSRHFNGQLATQELKKLEMLYLAAFTELDKVMNNNGRIVIIFPVFKIDKAFFFMQILGLLQKRGWIRRPYLPEKFNSRHYKEILNLSYTERDSIIFFRPDQTVSREIFIFEKAER